MRKGLLGGSFNPPHLGHLALARAALASGQVDRVMFIPAAIPPHKRLPTEVEIESRQAMTRLLCNDDDRLTVSDIEMRREGPSYTIDTVDSFKREDSDIAFRLIIGSDMALMFGAWKRHTELFQLAPPLVAERPGFPLKDFPPESFPGLNRDEIESLRMGSFPMSPVDISSTMIREKIKLGAEEEELRRYLSPTVIEYIKSNRLYGIID